MEEASSNNVDGGGDVRSVELQATPVMPFSKPYPTNPSNSKAIGFALGAPEMELRVSMEMHVAELSQVSIHCVCARAFIWHRVLPFHGES
uniref:Uncharacterized protein n=1 Tax=Zea mays TaxID=4577 RepID=A0A804PS60_MAIZE